MNDKTIKLQDERTKLYYDFYQNILPKRLPVWMPLSYAIAANYSNMDYSNVQFDFTKVEDATDEICGLVYSDRCPFPSGAGTERIASYYQILGSKCFKMSTGGYMQHPEISSMSADEYNELIKDPYAFILEKAIPRLYKNLDLEENPVAGMMSIPMANQAKQEDVDAISKNLRFLINKYGYTMGGTKGGMGSTEAPLDFLADLLRGFTGISIDIRRDREKVKEACDALYPIVFKFGMPPEPHFTGGVTIPIHMPPFMRAKDFEELYFPTLLRMARDYAAMEVRLTLFMEGNCMQHIDYLQDMPANVEYRFEYGDPKIVKDKLGDKFILGGFYPIQLLDTGTEQQVIDKAKELLDIMMPGGGYMFSFDKGTKGHKTINLKNMNALAVYLRDHARYENVGERFGKKLNSENFTVNENLLKLESKYAFNWGDFKRDNPNTPDFAKDRMQKYHDDMFKYVMKLMV